MLTTAPRVLVKNTKIKIIDAFKETKVNFLSFNVMNAQFPR